MNTEETVIDLVESLNFSGLNEGIILERKLYLCLISVLMINHIEHQCYSSLLDILYEPKQKKIDLEKFKTETIAFKFKQNGHRHLVAELGERFSNSINSEKLALLIKSSIQFYTDNSLKNLSIKSALEIYTHLLQRLQSMNMVDKLDKEFLYQDIPAEFSELASMIADKKSAHNIYDPYATTGELAINYVANSNVNFATTESVLQTSSYIEHMLYIAGANDTNLMSSFSLSQISNIKPNSMDVAFTLIEPKPSLEKVITTKIEPDLLEVMDEYEDGRIKVKSVPKKFKEHAFIQHILYSLAENGVGIIFIGKGLLQREVEKNVRSILLEGNFVEAVIELPAKLITHKTVALYALVIKKNRKNTKVKFIDASSFYVANGRYNQLCNLDDIASLYHSNKPVDGKLAIEPTYKIIKNEHSLVVSSYLSGTFSSTSKVDKKLVRKQLIEQQKETDALLGKIFKSL